LGRKSDKGLEHGEIVDKTFVFVRDDGGVGEKRSKATAGEDGDSVYLLIIDPANQAFHILLHSLLVFDKDLSPFLLALKSIITLFELILGKEANAFPLLLIVPFGIEIKGQERIRPLFDTGQSLDLAFHIHIKNSIYLFLPESGRICPVGFLKITL